VRRKSEGGATSVFLCADSILYTSSYDVHYSRRIDHREMLTMLEGSETLRTVFGWPLTPLQNVIYVHRDLSPITGGRQWFAAAAAGAAVRSLRPSDVADDVERWPIGNCLKSIEALLVMQLRCCRLDCFCCCCLAAAAWLLLLGYFCCLAAAACLLLLACCCLPAAACLLLLGCCCCRIF
jgi:hypothetical protein